MCIALIGGMDRLERRYVVEAERAGISLKVFNGTEARMTSRMGSVDAMVIFTNKVSHRARQEAMRVARTRNIPVMMRHSCGLCTLKDCLSCLKKEQGPAFGAAKSPRITKIHSGG